MNLLSTARYASQPVLERIPQVSTFIRCYRAMVDAQRQLEVARKASEKKERTTGRHAE